MFTLLQTTIYTTIYLKRNIVYFATQVPDTSDPIAIRTTLVWHEWDTSVTRVLHERHECDTSATRLKNFDFDNDTSENIFSHPYISYISNETLQGEEQFHSKNYLLEMTRSRAKMHLKSAPQNLNFVMAKAISKSYSLNCCYNCPCMFPHRNHFLWN